MNIKEDYTKRFSNIADIYEIGRPTYHNDAINFLKENINLDNNSLILDVGAGTGKLTNQIKILNHKKIFCIEPNKDMMSILEKKFDSSDIIKINTTAENLSMFDDNSISLITVGQALHWFDIPKFIDECKRILKKDGKLALFYNSRNTECKQAKEMINLLQKTCPKFSNYAGGLDEANTVKDEIFKDYKVLYINNPEEFDYKGWINRNLSSSYCVHKKEPTYDELIDGLTLIFNKYQDNGKIILKNNTVLFLGTIK